MPAFHKYPRDFTAKKAQSLLKLAGHTKNYEIVGFDQHLITVRLLGPASLSQSQGRQGVLGLASGPWCQLHVSVGWVMAHEDIRQCPG